MPGRDRESVKEDRGAGPAGNPNDEFENAINQLTGEEIAQVPTVGEARSNGPTQLPQFVPLNHGAGPAQPGIQYHGGYGTAPLPVPPPAAAAPRPATDSHSRLDRQLETIENLIGTVSGMSAKLDEMNRKINTRMDRVEARMDRMEQELSRQQGGNPPSAQPSDPSQAGQTGPAQNQDNQFLFL